MLIDTEPFKSRKITTTLACNARSKKRDNEPVRCQVDSAVVVVHATAKKTIYFKIVKKNV